MTTDDKIRDENCNMILTERLQKDQHCHLIKLKSMSILRLPNQNGTIEQSKFTFSPLRKAFQKQIKRIEDQEKNRLNLKVLKPAKQEQKPKSIEGIFPKDFRNFKQ